MIGSWALAAGKTGRFLWVKLRAAGMLPRAVVALRCGCTAVLPNGRAAPEISQHDAFPALSPCLPVLYCRKLYRTAADALMHRTAPLYCRRQEPAGAVREVAAQGQVQDAPGPNCRRCQEAGHVVPQERQGSLIIV